VESMYIHNQLECGEQGLPPLIAEQGYSI